jgi:hypothetical protein
MAVVGRENSMKKKLRRGVLRWLIKKLEKLDSWLDDLSDCRGKK